MTQTPSETKTLTSIDSSKKADGTLESEPITRDTWHQTYTYSCMEHCLSNCSSLRVRGCIQIKSECLSQISGICTTYRQTYKCKSKKHKSKTYTAKGDHNPFCLTGNCVDSSYEENGEMLDALTHLNVLKEVQDDIRANLGIFKGQSRSCRKNCAGFRDCCTTGKGWGVTLHLSECSGEEKELADWRDKKQCVLVGTYCAEKALGRCIRKKTSFCCFGTKLSRLIQEGGRRQLGLSFGTPEHPDCRGLTPEELSRLDLSQIDLSELYEDIQESFKATPKLQLDKAHMAKGLELERIRENMGHMMSKSKANPEGKPL